MNRRLTAAVAASLALVACANDDPATPRANPSVSATATVPATPTPTVTVPVTPSATATATPAGTMRVPVYFLGGTQQRPVLFREFRSVPRQATAATAAVEAMLRERPLDGDYYSLWPAGTKVTVTQAADTATVDLPAAARSVKATRAQEQASIQQLVHTVTAADPALRHVRLTFGGKTAPTLWGSVDVSGRLSRGAQIDVLAPIWVIEPAQGAKVKRTFTVSGTAAVFEATVSWAVTRPGSTTQLAHGFVTASEGAPGRGTFSVKVTLPQGTTGDVVFTAWESSAEDGRPLHPDSKTYRVA